MSGTFRSFCLPAAPNRSLALFFWSVQGSDRLFFLFERGAFLFSFSRDSGARDASRRCLTRCGILFFRPLQEERFRLSFFFRIPFFFFFFLRRPCVEDVLVLSCRVEEGYVPFFPPLPGRWKGLGFFVIGLPFFFGAAAPRSGTLFNPILCGTTWVPAPLFPFVRQIVDAPAIPSFHYVSVFLSCARKGARLPLGCTGSTATQKSFLPVAAVRV